MKVKPHLLDQYLKIIDEDAKGTRKYESAVRRLDVLRDPKDHLKFTFYEVYENEAAFKRHQV